MFRSATGPSGARNCQAPHPGRLSIAVILLALLLAPAPARAQSGENVLLVTNDRSPISATIADHYARARGVPQNNRVRITAEPSDEVTRADYERLIEAPIARWISRNAAHDRILYVVLAKGVPLRIGGTSGRGGTIASVDSELTLLYRKMTGVRVAVAGQVANPFYGGDTSVAQAKLFSHLAHDIYLVTRLDGFTERDVLALIDRGAASSRDGVIVLDGKAGWDEAGNKWLQAAADWLTANGFKDRLVFDTTSRVLTDQANVLGYYSWGSNDPAIKVRRFGFTFAPGALAGMYVSSDGRSFAEPPADWQIGSWNNRKTFFANSPQSLTGDLIHEGATGASGHVAEPYLDATIRPQLLFPAYLSGLNLAESFYLAMPYLSWQTVVVGDPLCVPFPRKALAPADIDKGLDPATELPALFSERRLQAAIALSRGAKPEAVKLTLKAEARQARDDPGGARQALEEATAIDVRLDAAHLALASMYEQAAEYDRAMDRYRTIVASDPANGIALNNLAYALAVRKNQPADALPLAQKAFTLLRGNPTVADTLGWVHHLLGNEAEAGRLIGAAVKALPANAELRFHLAAVLAAIGSLEAAATELARAVELDPELEKQDAVKQLRVKLKR